MTQREFLNAIVDVEAEGMDEVKAVAAEMLAKLDATNAAKRGKAAEKAAKREIARGPIRDAIVSVMGAEPKTATTLIAEAGVDMTPQTIPSLLKGLLEEGKVVKAEIKVTGKGKQVGYALAGDMAE